MTDQADRLVLVTGAASGIGAATARLLQANGARVIVMDRHEDGLSAFANCHAVVGDVADPALWESIDLSGLTHAVLNAGISDGGMPIADLPFSDWRRVMAINLDGAFASLGAAMRAIRATGKGGAVVLTASATGIKAQPRTAAYSASKAAVIQLAKVAALEGAPDNIRVNCIAPSGVETPMWRDMPFFRDLVATSGSEAAAFAAIAQGDTPLGRFATAEEIAAQICFLLSDAAATITGTCLVSDGGYTL